MDHLCLHDVKGLDDNVVHEHLTAVLTHVEKLLQEQQAEECRPLLGDRMVTTPLPQKQRPVAQLSENNACPRHQHGRPPLCQASPSDKA